MPDIPETAGASPRSSRAGLWVLLLILAVGGGMWFVDSWTRDLPDEPPRLLGSVWTAKLAAQPLLYFVMEEQRRQRRIPSYAQRRNWFTVSYSLFTLQARDAHSGALRGQAELARIDNAVFGEGPEILGPLGEVLWVWNGALEGRRLDTLEPLWTTEKLRERNPEYAALLPVDRQYYKVLGELNVLVFKGKDARYFQIEAATGKIQPLDETVLGSHFHTRKADDAFTYLDAESNSLSSTSIGGLMWNSLTVGDRWYALLSADERANLVDSPGNGNAPWGEAARTLHGAAFEWEDRKLLGTQEIKLDSAAVKPLGSERLLMAGFLRRPNTNALWTMDEGKSFLVLHRNELGDDSPWQLTRLGLDGAVRWTRSTGLADPVHLSDGQGVVVFSGFAVSGQSARHRPDLLVFIDEHSGAARTLNLVSHEIVEAAPP